ncbi:MAG: DEAD/DEAH box helicase family protein, partial [Abditibacteriota bacterium]|nr:DEAD/DEAH box helicase family protein [Abditibacteriota bacterium]
MADFYSLIDEIRKNARSERDKGTRFERLIKNYLKTSRKYSSRVKEVWMWSDFPYRSQFGGGDVGIDLVALTVDGEYWAVQCKCYGPKTTIEKGTADTFLSTSSRTFDDSKGVNHRFSHRFWISTANKWTGNGDKVFQNQDPPAYVITPDVIAGDESVDWDKLASGVDGRVAVKKKIMTPKIHQKEALSAAHEYFKTHDRGKLIMACGTGKTFTSLRMCENETENSGLILFLAPSIALINQTLNEWQACAQDDIYPICVCSDSRASMKREYDDEGSVGDLAKPACTEPRETAKRISDAEKTAANMVVVYSTY